MAKTQSTMLPLGTTAPDFSLPDTDGSTLHLEGLKNKTAYLVMFICNHCPYVKHVRKELVRLNSDYANRGVALIAINSNDVKNYPDDSPKMMAKEKKDQGYQFPYLFDESQSVARAYNAVCTPDFFLFDRAKKLVYRGQLDDSRPGSDIAVSGHDIRQALNGLLEGRHVDQNQKPSVGCGIKWKSS